MVYQARVSQVSESASVRGGFRSGCATQASASASRYEVACLHPRPEAGSIPGPMPYRRHRRIRFARIGGVLARSFLAVLFCLHVQSAALHVLTSLHSEGAPVHRDSEDQHDSHEDHAPHPASAHAVHAVSRSAPAAGDLGVLGPSLPVVFPAPEYVSVATSFGPLTPSAESPPAAIRFRAPPIP